MASGGTVLTTVPGGLYHRTAVIGGHSFSAQPCLDVHGGVGLRDGLEAEPKSFDWMFRGVPSNCRLSQLLALFKSAV